MKANSVVLVLLLISFGLGAIPARGSDGPTPLEQGRALRAKADAGDPKAMFDLALLLMNHAPQPKTPMKFCDGKPVNPLIKPKPGANCVTVQDKANVAQLKEWESVGTKFNVAQWLERAAAKGEPRARKILCDVGNDADAPASMRESASQWCEPQ
jgi:hypothetical protein